MLRTVGAHVSPPPGAQPATRWGTEEVVAGLLGEGVTDVHSETAKVTQRFTDAGAFADLFLTYYGPTFAAAGRLDDQGRAALRADLVAWSNHGEGGTPARRNEVRKRLRHWRNDRDLAGLRDEAELAKLPKAERAACRDLWARVHLALLDLDFPVDPFVR